MYKNERNACIILQELNRFLSAIHVHVGQLQYMYTVYWFGGKRYEDK